MNLLDLVRRRSAPEPWAEGEKIPWNDAGFSQRMLREHLAQDHDLASRRRSIIDRHVAWIHQTLLGGQPAAVLDLGCGPGLYAMALARHGHQVMGIDFSPASIAYAKTETAQAGLSCRFVEGNIRSAPFGAGYQLAMLIFGEFNVFRPEDAVAILHKIHAALDDGGLLLLEPQTFEAVRRTGLEPPTWYTSSSGLFSETPHLVLKENFWHETQQVASERYFVVDAATATVTRHADSVQAYSETAYRRLMETCGFTAVEIFPSLHGESDPGQAGLFALTARKA